MHELAHKVVETTACTAVVGSNGSESERTQISTRRGDDAEGSDPSPRGGVLPVLPKAREAERRSESRRLPVRPEEESNGPARVKRRRAREVSREVAGGALTSPTAVQVEQRSSVVRERVLVRRPVPTQEPEVTGSVVQTTCVADARGNRTCRTRRVH
jgi:hypothetical protein